MENLLIVHGGAPTSVINSSLGGVLSELKSQKFKGKILAAKFGTTGILAEDLIDLSNVSNERINLLKRTPGSSIGTSRTPLIQGDYEKIVEIIKKYNIKYVLFNGGNGSMDTLGKIHSIAKDAGIKCVGIPKTVDNDIMETDHAPGFASAARYLARSVKEMAEDIKGMPIHVSVIESMGRNAGWLTAASAASRKKKNDAPHLLLCPECPFDESVFLSNVERLYRLHKGVIVVASEGLKYKDGTPIVSPVFKVGRATYFGDVSSHLSELIIKNLGIKSRSEKPGILQRCAVDFSSNIDSEEAFLVGKEGARAVISGASGVMVALERVSSSPYVITTKLVEIEKVMLKEKTFPLEYLTPDKTDVTDKFIEWIEPLIGKLPEFLSFLH